MRGKPSIDEFLEGGREKETSTNAPKQAAPMSGPDKRTKKLFEFPESLILDLERRCTEERAKRGRRVTQREVMETLLRKYVRGEVSI